LAQIRAPTLLAMIWGAPGRPPLSEQCAGADRPAPSEPATPGLTSGLPRVVAGLAAGHIVVQGIRLAQMVVHPGTWRTIEMISSTISPRAPPVAPLSK
jgi:hypothetical protein